MCPNCSVLGSHNSHQAAPQAPENSEVRKEHWLSGELSNYRTLKVGVKGLCSPAEGPPILLPELTVHSVTVLVAFFSATVVACFFSITMGLLSLLGV